MKLGKRKSVFIKAILIFLFMFFTTITTINYLYNSLNITKDEYFKLLLSDTFNDNFYINLVEIINKNFNPINMIEFKNKEKNNLTLYNSNIEKPIIYIYNSNQDINYKNEYNIDLPIMLSSYLLSNEFNKLNINSIFEENNINTFSNNNNISIKDTIDIFINDKLTKYSSIKYIINIGVNNDRNTGIKVGEKKYALISMYANEENISLLNEINKKLNERYKGISKIYVDTEYNKFINIDFGNNNNSMKEVFNSIQIFANVFKEVI